MENLKDPAQEPGPVPTQPAYTPTGFARKDYFRDDARYKSPALATIMSLMPGLGQIYIGYYQQGFINIVVIAGLISLLARGETHFTPFLALFMAFYWLYNMVDAGRKATFYNQALAGLSAQEFPEGGQMPGTRGSLVGGVLLMVAGAIALANTRFGMPLDWIERWWPMALVLMGAWLLYQSVGNKGK
jgi:hypothetical protein